MGDATNREEVEKCKRIATVALDAGDCGKAIRFLEKAQRMGGGEAIDALLAKARSGECSAPSGGGGGDYAPPPEADSGPRFRSAPSASRSSASTSAGGGNTRTNKAGETYTTEQSQMVQKILRTKDYYDMLDLPRESSEEAVKKAYKKLALKLHPDKNKAPGAEEAFKKISKSVQCLTDPDKRKVYDKYGDEDRIPQQQRQHYQQDFMTPEDLFAAFFGGGAFHHGHGHHRHDGERGQGEARPQLLQMLPVLILVLLTLASNFAPKGSSGRFSFTPSGQYVNERSSRTLGSRYYVSNDFEEHYPDGSKGLAEFERQVEIYHVRNLHSDCDYQEKVMYKKVMMAKRSGNQEEIAKARKHPRPACKELERVKQRHANIYRSAIYMGY